MPVAPLKIVPASARNWAELERLFGPRGACAGCWCMWWRLARKSWEQGKTGANRRAFRGLVADANPPPGLIAFAEHRAVGWCAVAPRATYARFARSRVLAPV